MSAITSILLVDDQPTNLHALSRALADEYQLFIATSGGAALSMIAQRTFDLVLLDVMMPEMDGLETLQRLRSSDRGRDIPVILITADDRSETQVQGLELGAEDFIAKPLIVPVVQARVRNALQRRCFKQALIALNGDLARSSDAVFFRAACRLLGEQLGMDSVFVARLEEQSSQVIVIDGWRTDDQPMPPLAYPLAGSPCAEVVRSGLRCYPDNVPSHFPEARSLIDMGVNAYVGSPLLDKRGNTLGVLVALRRDPLSDRLGGLASSLFELFVDRIASEIQRSADARSMEFRLAFQRIATDVATALAVADTDAAIDATIDRCLQRLGELFKADRSYVFGLTEDLRYASNTHEWCAEGVRSVKNTLRSLPLDAMTWWMGPLLRDGVLHVPRVDELPPEAAAEQAEWRRQGVRTLLLASMHGVRGKLTGFMGFDGVRVEKNWSNEEQAMLQTMAGILGSAIERQRMREALIASEQRFGLLVNNSSDIVVLMDVCGIQRYVSSAAEAITGFKPEELVGKAIPELIHPDDIETVTRRWNRLVDKPGSVQTAQYRHIRKTGDWVHLEAIGQNFLHTPAVSAIVLSVRDITARKRTEDQLRQAASVFEHANEGILITDPEGVILDVNAAFSRITGYRREEALGRTPRILNSGRQNEAFYAAMWQQLLREGTWSGELWNRRKSGEIYAELLTISAVRAPDGCVQRYVALFTDISAQKAHQRQLEQIAHYDALTGLPNRMLLADRLNKAMTQVRRPSQQIAVVYLDLDGFKGINDVHGHATGDRLLVAIAGRLRDALREGDTLARIGGDEFVAVLVDLRSAELCLPLLHRLLEAAAEPVCQDGRLLQVSASLGVTFYPQLENIEADQLLRQADQAMYQAKLAGKNRYHLFDTAHDRDLRGRHESLERIREGLIGGEFVLYYQPKVNLRRGRVIGAEALVRWLHPERGLLTPGAFLPLLDHHPLMIELGDWVLETALAQIANWRGMGLALPVSVNIDPLQLARVDFIDKLHTALARHPTVQAGDLELEVLETSALEDITHISGIIDACQALGIRFALDDFGTGYSSLAYLKRLPVETLKIDQSFVHDMLDDPDDLAILQGVIGLADVFRRQVIAEGVETEAHGEVLLRLGCELGQGYAIARPMPAERIPAWLTQWRPPASWVAAAPPERPASPAGSRR